MQYRDLDRWDSLFRMNPDGQPVEEVRKQAATAVRQLCVDLNNKGDRVSVHVGLVELERMGRLLAAHGWLVETTR